MDNKNKARWGFDLKMIALIALGIIAILSSVGCFNYATLAKKAGDPDNLFWLVGIVNILYNGYIIYRLAKKWKSEGKEPKPEDKSAKK